MIHMFIGTKAQLIKMAPIMRILDQRKITYNFIFSGQHKDTISELLKNFGIRKPDIILHNGEDITKISQMILWGVKIIFLSITKKKYLFKNDRNGIIINHGDTFSTLLGTIIAKTNGFKSAHVESGLRSFNLFHPFPEEIIRIIVFHLSDFYFCPNKWALANIQKYKGEKYNTKQNTLYDAIKLAVKAKKVDIKIPETEYVIVSLHRYENIFNKKKLKQVLNIVKSVSMKYKILFILHPPTLNKLKQYHFYNELKSYKNIELSKRYDYFDFIALVKGSVFVISDGGGNQEECFMLGKPCLLLRKVSERKEGLGKNILISNYDKSRIDNFLSNYKQFITLPLNLEITPSEIIVNALIEKEF